MSAIKRAFADREGKKNFVCMLVSILVLLAFSPLIQGSFTTVLTFIISFASLYFGDRFVRIVGQYQAEEQEQNQNNN